MEVSLKPSEGKLPVYMFTVALVCYQLCPANSDFSSVVICWLSEDIETSLPELIEREIRTVEWDMHAVCI